MTDLEGPQDFLLVASLLLLRPFGPDRTSRRTQQWAALVAWVALGLALTIKIWELAPIVVLTGWLALGPRRRVLGWCGIGVVGSVCAICLPFFLVAPKQMLTMVMYDELHRPWHPGWAKRPVYTTGTNHLLSIGGIGIGLVLVLVGLGLTVAVAWRLAAARVVVVLYLVLFGVLLASPPTFVHYGAFPGPPLAILAGVATAEVVELIRQLRPAAVRLIGEGIVAAGCAESW